MKKRILMATFGSLGDLHPYIAIGRELCRRGHVAVIATTDRYRATVEANGIVFHALRPAESQLGDPAELIARAFHPVTGTKFLLERTVMPYLRESYEDHARAGASADVVLTHPLTMTAVLVAQKRGLPWASSVLAPLSLLSTFDPPLFPAARWLRALRRLGHAPYRAAFGLIKRSCASWERPVQQLRRELGLPAAPPALFEGQYSPACNLALFSPLLAEPAMDWPANTTVCGFARYDGAATDDATLSRLHAFIAAGSAPLVFALGSSAVWMAGDFWETAVRATRRLGRRAILLTGSAANPHYGTDIASFEYLPYSSVFPHAAAVVHQAGMGTLAQALAAGRPQVLVPISFDQPDNADRAARLGAGPIVPFNQITVRRLEAALRQALPTRPPAHIAERIRAEDGAAKAADALLSL